jgi:hypothetical protein
MLISPVTIFIFKSVKYKIEFLKKPFQGAWMSYFNNRSFIISDRTRRIFLVSEAIFCKRTICDSVPESNNELKIKNNSILKLLQTVGHHLWIDSDDVEY